MSNVPSETMIAVAQFAPTNDSAANLASISALAATAASRGATLVVFPEYSSYFVPELGQELVDASEALDGPFVTAIGELAKNLGIYIVAGLIEAIDESARFSNTVVALSSAGTLVASYRKLHLYDAFGASESTWVRPGAIEPPATFAFAGFTVGLQTCYDLRFPEVTRRLVDAGATLVLVPSEWVSGALKEHHWRTLLTARALENTLYVAAADHCPPIGVGNSLIVDPMGVAIATVGETVDVATATISLARVEAVRARNPAVSLRRFTVIPRITP